MTLTKTRAWMKEVVELKTQIHLCLRRLMLSDQRLQNTLEIQELFTEGRQTWRHDKLQHIFANAR